jgi:peptidoglycan/xylan/chitin deacetylase (PgdA/CDA1 family)
MDQGELHPPWGVRRNPSFGQSAHPPCTLSNGTRSCGASRRTCPEDAGLVLTVQPVDRRTFLLALAAGLTVAAAGRGSDGPQPPSRIPTAAADRPSAAVPRTVEARPASDGMDLPAPAPPPVGAVAGLPGPGPLLALTIDDGTSTEVVAAFTALAAGTGIRLTFFPNGRYDSWRENAPALRPLVDSGQVALGNHTWSHLDLTTLDDAAVAEEIRRNADFLRDVFGVHDSPFFRPPYGARDERIDRIAADLGHPTVALWNGTLDDARPVSGDELVAAARRWFVPQAIVVGHANAPTIAGVFDRLLAVLEERGLRTVTLADVWATPGQRVRGARASAVAAVG